MPATSSTIVRPSSSAAFASACFFDFPPPTRRRLPAASVYSIVHARVLTGVPDASSTGFPDASSLFRLKIDAMSGSQDGEKLDDHDDEHEGEKQRRDEPRAARDRSEDEAGE